MHTAHHTTDNRNIYGIYFCTFTVSLVILCLPYGCWETFVCVAETLPILIFLMLMANGHPKKTNHLPRIFCFHTNNKNDAIHRYLIEHKNISVRKMCAMFNGLSLWMKWICKIFCGFKLSPEWFNQKFHIFLLMCDFFSFLLVWHAANDKYIFYFPFPISKNQ